MIAEIIIGIGIFIIILSLVFHAFLKIGGESDGWD